MKKIVALLIIMAMSAMMFACGSAGANITTVTTVITSSTTAPIVIPNVDPVEPYADIDFTEDSIADSKEKITLSAKATGQAQTPYVEEISVSFAGYTKTLPVLCIKESGTWVKGVFNDIADSSEMDEFVENAGGFTIEVFYLDNSTTGANRGIVCSIESIGGDAKRSGWGIAENVEGVPYFITGHTAENEYSVVYGTKALETEPVHVIAVYNAATQRIAIYINGTLSSSNSAAGKFTSSNKTEAYEGFEMGNAFYIGADPSSSPNKKEACDFPSNDLIVIDIKFYDKALSADEVSAAYAETLKIFK